MFNLVDFLVKMTDTHIRCTWVLHIRSRLQSAWVQNNLLICVIKKGTSDLSRHRNLYRRLSCSRPVLMELEGVGRSVYRHVCCIRAGESEKLLAAQAFCNIFSLRSCC